MGNQVVIVVACAGTLLARLLWQFIRLSLAPNAKLPGPWYTKYTSAVYYYKEIKGTGTVWVHRLHEKYGDIVRLSPTEVDFSSINAAKTIHSYRKPFAKSSYYNATEDTIGVSSMFSTRDPATHGRFRRLFSASTSESSMKLVEPHVNAMVDLAIQRIQEEIQFLGHADVMKWWLFMAADVSGQLSFGESFRMLEQKKKNQYVADLEYAAIVAAMRNTFRPLIEMATKLRLPLFRETRAVKERISVYAEESLQRYKRMQIVEPQNFKPTFFTNLIQAGEKDGDTITWKEITNNAELFIVAGADTTANTLTYLVWQMSRVENRAPKKRLLEELATLPKDFTNNDLKSLPYLHCVIKETLRLHAPVPGSLPRDVPKGGAEVDGVWFPEGTVAITQAYSLHRISTVFHDPERFDPSRWENPTKEMDDAFMAWGGGPRSCIGIHLAYMELRLGTAKYFLTFPHSKVSAKEGFCDNDMEMKISFLMSPKNHRCLVETE